MRTTIVLTVPESKRLIAKGIANMGLVKNAMQNGLVCVATGTTNALVVEELLGKSIDKMSYVTGVTLPTKLSSKRPNVKPLPDVIFKNGELTREYDRFSVVRAMSQGDVFIKGANALNYERGVAGILIGDQNGGTTGAALGSIIGRRVNFVIPVGLEKNIATDIEDAADVLQEADEYVGDSPRLWPVRGYIVTEIEALSILTGVSGMQVAAGGVGGAEGSVRLLLDGTKEILDDTMRFLDEHVYGEKDFFVLG